MTSRQMADAAESLGMRAGGLYFRGRIAAVGDVAPQVAVSLLGIFPAYVIELTWRGSQTLPIEAALGSYSLACAEWGRANLVALPDAERLADTAEQVCDAAEASALPLFAAWRAQPRPTDLAARAAFALMLLRELRGGIHFAALRTQGLDVPLAVVGDPFGGEDRLRRTAWQDDAVAALATRAAAMPDLRARWSAAEAATDVRYREMCSVLPADDERALADLVVAAEQLTR